MEVQEMKNTGNYRKPFSVSFALASALVTGGTLVDQLFKFPAVDLDGRIMTQIAGYRLYPSEAKAHQTFTYFQRKDEFREAVSQGDGILGGIWFAQNKKEETKNFNYICDFSNSLVSDVLRVMPAKDLSALYPLAYEHAIAKKDVNGLKKEYPKLWEVAAPAFEHSQQIADLPCSLEDIKRVGRAADIYEKRITNLLHGQAEKGLPPENEASEKREAEVTFDTLVVSAVRSEYDSFHLTKLLMLEPAFVHLIDGQFDPAKKGSTYIEKIAGSYDPQLVDRILKSESVSFDRQELITKTRAAYSGVIVFGGPGLDFAARRLPEEDMMKEMPVDLLKPSDPELVRKNFVQRGLGGRTFANMMRAALE
jgi:hypothetical protein